MAEKTDIIETRSIGFGSSDAKMLASVGKNGKLTKTAEDRIAVMLKQKEKKNFSTPATDYGDFIENSIYAWIKEHQKSKGYVFNSNPYYEIPDLKYRFKCFNHIDIEAIKPQNVAWFEVKAVNDDLQKTLVKYKEQLEWHLWVLKSKYPSYNIKLYLVHYHTKDKMSYFNPAHISLIEYTGNDKLKVKIISGLEYIDRIIDTFRYSEPNKLGVSRLPEQLQKQLDEIYLFKKQESEMKVKIKNFTDKMNELMTDKNIDSIKTETILLTRIKETETKSVDLDYLEKHHPKVYKKCLTTKMKKGYVSLKTL